MGGLFPQSILHAFAFLGLVLPVYLLIFANLIGAAYRSRVTVLTAAVLCLMVATIWIAVPSTYDHDAGRWASIVWTLSRFGPELAGRPSTLLLFELAGAMFAAFLVWLALDRCEIRPVLLGLFLYIVAQIFMPLAFQRYIEPMVLMSLGLIAACFATVATWRLTLFATIFSIYSLIGLLRICDAFPSALINP